MNKHRFSLKSAFPFSWRDALVTVGIIALASALCAFLKLFSDSDFHVPLIFVLATLMVSLMTTGYLFGVVTSVVAVLGVNIVFTYPYFRMNFSLTGYPLTFLCMFAVSIITCTLASRVKESERVRIEAEREKTRANLLRAISHDFRTPLTSMIGSINVIRESGEMLTEAEKNKLLDDAKSEAEWLINMVENLLSITRIGGDPNAALHKEPQVVEEVLWEAVTRFRRQYPALKVDIRIPEEPLLVEMDAVLIEQVILNLLINAAIHGKSATSAILSAKKVNGNAVFSVEDNGSGIASEKLAHLFDGYGSHSGGDSDANRTMGIGLSVCNTIVTAHGGKMMAENLPGGARLSFTLPCAEQKTQSEDLPYGNQTEDSDCGG